MLKKDVKLQLTNFSTLSYKVDLVPGTQESSSAVSSIQRFNTVVVGWVTGRVSVV